MAPRRVVLDCNTIVSRLLSSRSVPARAVDLALERDRVLSSDATMMELAEVLSRSKFDPYVTIADRQEFLSLFNRVAEQVEIVSLIRACRDSKDNKFLELAVDGSADLIVTGDADLLALNPFGAIRIITPARFVEES